MLPKCNVLVASKTLTLEIACKTSLLSYLQDKLPKKIAKQVSLDEVMPFHAPRAPKWHLLML